MIAFRNLGGGSLLTIIEGGRALRATTAVISDPRVTNPRRRPIDAVGRQRGSAGERDTRPGSPVGNPNFASHCQQLIDAAVKSGLIGMIVLAPLANGSVSRVHLLQSRLQRSALWRYGC